MSRINVGRKFVIAAAEVLDEGVSCADHSGRAQLFETAHRDTLDNPQFTSTKRQRCSASNRTDFGPTEPFSDQVLEIHTLAGNPQAATAAITALRKALRALGSPRQLRRMPGEGEVVQQRRLLALARRMSQPHMVASMTVHQAKGREWPVVGVRLADDQVARLSAGLKQDRFDDRVLYVAITRAARRVVRS